MRNDLDEKKPTESIIYAYIAGYIGRKIKDNTDAIALCMSFQQFLITNYEGLFLIIVDPPENPKYISIIYTPSLEALFYRKEFKIVIDINLTTQEILVPKQETILTTIQGEEHTPIQALISFIKQETEYEK